jgi:flagellar biosynthesis protein FlhA
VESAAVEKKKADQAQGSDLANLLRLEELTLEIGFQLIPLVDEKQGGQLLSRVRSLRRHLSAELGFLVPPVHISDNLRLRPREYLLSLRGLEIGPWQARMPASRHLESRLSGLPLRLRTRPSLPATRWSMQSP